MKSSEHNSNRDHRQLLVAAGVIALVALATALIETVTWKVMAVAVVVVGIFLMQGLVAALVRGPVTWRDHLLIFAAAFLYPALTGAFLIGFCRMPLPFVAPGCDPEVTRRVAALNFFFSLIGFLGPWLASRFDQRQG